MMIEYVPDGPEVELLDLREVTGKGPGARRLWTASLRDASAKIGSFVHLYHYLCHPDCSVKKNVCYDVTPVILESQVGLGGKQGWVGPRRLYVVHAALTAPPLHYYTRARNH